MMRSVLNEGTGARRARSRVHAGRRREDPARPTICATRGSSGSRPKLLTVVWVGLDDNQPLGLSGTQAALPIWTAFMMRALGGRTSGGFEAPEGIVFVDIDATRARSPCPACPRIFHESFLAGTEPTEACTYTVLASLSLRTPRISRRDRGATSA